MGRHQNFYSAQPSVRQERDRQIHPIWRGVGFMFLIIIPALSYIATLALLDANTANHWMGIPPELISQWGEPLLWIKIILTVVIALVFYALFMLITFFVYRFLGPERYGPLDAPPVKGRVKRSR